MSGWRPPGTDQSTRSFVSCAPVSVELVWSFPGKSYELHFACPFWISPPSVVAVVAGDSEADVGAGRGRVGLSSGEAGMGSGAAGADGGGAVPDIVVGGAKEVRLEMREVGVRRGGKFRCNAARNRRQSRRDLSATRARDQINIVIGWFRARAGAYEDGFERRPSISRSYSRCCDVLL